MKYSYHIYYSYTTLIGEGTGRIGVTRESKIIGFNDLKEIENSLKEQFGYTFCIITNYELLSNRI